MNTRRPPPADAVDIAGALAWARTQIDQMDARVLLRHVLQCPAARLVAWPEHKLANEDWANYRGLVERRVAGEPVAYLTGTREFYGREFMVTPAVLITRDPSCWSNSPSPDGAACVLDMGTGSGALAVTLALEMDTPDVIALDRSREALWVAMANAARLNERVLRAERLVRRARRRAVRADRLQPTLHRRRRPAPGARRRPLRAAQRAARRPGAWTISPKSSPAHRRA